MGRFPSVDPIIEKFAYLTPYNYASDNPVSMIDLYGLQGQFFQDASDFLGGYYNGKVDAVVEIAKNGNPVKQVENAVNFVKGAIENPVETTINTFLPGKQYIDRGIDFAEKLMSGDTQGAGEQLGKTEVDLAVAVGAAVLGAKLGTPKRSGTVTKVAEAVEGGGQIHKFNSAESLIQGAGELTKVKSGLQGFVKGDGPSIFNAISEGGVKQVNGTVLMQDGTTLFNHSSTKTGVYTIDINKANQVYKIRIGQ